MSTSNGGNAVVPPVTRTCVKMVGGSRELACRGWAQPQRCLSKPAFGGNADAPSTDGRKTQLEGVT